MTSHRLVFGGALLVCACGSHRAPSSTPGPGAGSHADSPPMAAPASSTPAASNALPHGAASTPSSSAAASPTPPTTAAPSAAPLVRGSTPEAAASAAKRAAAASAAAPRLSPVARAPVTGWAYGRVDAWRQYACAASPQKSATVSVVVTLGLHSSGKKSALHVVADRSEEAADGCSFSGGPSSMLRVSFEGESTLRGARRIHRFTSWRSGELLAGHDTFSRLEQGSSTLTLDCGSAKLQAHAYEADDDRENTAGFWSSMVPSVSVINCKVSAAPLPHALFEQWLYQGQLLLAPEPGVELRTALYDEMDPVVAVRVGSKAPAYSILRERAGIW